MNARTVLHTAYDNLMRAKSYGLASPEYAKALHEYKAAWGGLRRVAKARVYEERVSK